jgi:hypothetical protein
MISPGNRIAEPTTREPVEQLLGLPGSIGELRTLAGQLGSADSRQTLEDLARQQNELVTGTVTAIEQLVDQGWAVSRNIDPRCSVDAAALYANDQDSEKLSRMSDQRDRAIESHRLRRTDPDAPRLTCWFTVSHSGTRSVVRPGTSANFTDSF